MGKFHITHYYHRGIRKVCTVMNIRGGVLVIDADLRLDAWLYRVQMILASMCVLSYACFGLLVTVQTLLAHSYTTALYCATFTFITICMGARAIVLATQHRREQGN